MDCHPVAALACVVKLHAARCFPCINHIASILFDTVVRAATSFLPSLWPLCRLIIPLNVSSDWWSRIRKGRWPSKAASSTAPYLEVRASTNREHHVVPASHNHHHQDWPCQYVKKNTSVQISRQPPPYLIFPRRSKKEAHDNTYILLTLIFSPYLHIPSRPSCVIAWVAGKLLQGPSNWRRPHQPAHLCGAVACGLWPVA